MQNGFWSGVATAGAGAVLALTVIAMAGAGEAAEISSGTDLKFWGRAVFNVHYDTAIQAQDFMSYLTDDQTEELNFNPRDTRFGFAATQTEGDWTYGATLEIDFYGDNASNNLLPRLRLGYAEAKNAKGLTIRGGQDWIPVAQQNPGTIDFGIQSWSGDLWWRVPQFTVRYQSGDAEYLVSAMKHRISTDQEMQETMPWLLGRIGLCDAIGEGSLIAIGGGVRSANEVVFSRIVEEETQISTADYSSYLAALELKVPFGETGVVLTGEAYIGTGIGREFVHYGFDYNPWHPDGAKEIESKGGFLSLMIPASPRIEINAGYGLDDPTDEDLAGIAAPYLENSSIFGNLKYKVTKNFGWGVEVMHLITDTGGADELAGQRFTGSWWYVF
ncbi:MAG TPA: hypothetical protein PLL30_12705 [Candidatus Krumholzibacteria bacterium]|nr:hypothetical protein [Candidatus Krumholzibacteria bacterium]